MNDSPRYPRVLVVGQPFDRSTGGGITLSNLFEGWPQDRLANVVLPGTPIAHDVCDHFYSLGTSEARWRWPLSLVSRKETPPSGAVEQLATAPAPGTAWAGAGDSHRGAHRLLKAVVRTMGAQDVLRRMRPSQLLLDWVQDFEPDVIYSQLSDLPMIDLVHGLVARTGVPLVLHFMDDWPETEYRHGALAPLARSAMRRGLGSLLNRAEALLAISEEMAAEYSERYSRPFTTVHNPVDLERWDALASAHPRHCGNESDQSLAIIYAGRIGRANTSSLLDVAEAVGRVASNGRRARLYVYTNDVRATAAAAMEALPGVAVRPGVPYEEVPGLLGAADALLLPLDFDERALRFARLSMPTKVSEYLAAGRPVLTYAPQESAVARYAREGEWSLVVSARVASLVDEALRRLLDEPTLRREMGERGRQLAEAQHDARRVRARFADILAGAGVRDDARAGDLPPALAP